MTINDCCTLTEKVKSVLYNCMWKGVMTHPEKTEMLEALTFAITILQNLNEEKIVEILREAGNTYGDFRKYRKRLPENKKSLPIHCAKAIIAQIGKSK